MALWLDKYRPKKLNKLDFHKKQADHLEKLVKSGDFPHLLVHGTPGSGKKTRVMALLRELYGNGVDRLRIGNVYNFFIFIDTRKMNARFAPIFLVPVLFYNNSIPYVPIYIINFPGCLSFHDL